ncbi:MAG: PIN domain-containing protein [Candidatus Micrarchaeota archaeon]
MVVLDTTFIIHFLKNKENALQKAQEINEPVYTTRLNIFEILAGINLKKEEEKQPAFSIFNDFLYSVKILELDEKSTKKAAEIYAYLHKKGETVDKIDVLIASMGITNNQEKIITDNVKDFSKIPGIIVEKY